LRECGPLPLGVLSSKLALPTLTIQRVVEPYLLKEDFITKTRASVRLITEKGIKQLSDISYNIGNERMEDRNGDGE
jgi:Holliday junction resolvasome RuvABC ATP-dependent DNA helicase subunit